MSDSPSPVSIPRDFPDWLSPIIVKEVRQGLRSHVFAIAFMLLHLLLIFWCLSSVADSSQNSSEADFFFWSIFFLGLVVLVLRGQGVVRSEIRGNTLELLQLTRQSAWRIVLGKWSSLMLQILIFIASLLPYAVLRYFFGGLTSIVGDMFLFLCAILVAAVLTAVVVFTSCFGIWLNIIVSLLGSFLLVTGGSGFFFSRHGIGMRISLTEIESVYHIAFALAILLGYTVVYSGKLLSLAASRIASVSDNLATRKRIFALLLLLPPWIALLCHADNDVLFATLGAALPAGLVMIDATLAATSPSIPAFKPFNRLGILGRLTAFLLGPSQGGGVVFSLLALLLFFLPLCIEENREVAVVAISSANALLLPFALAILLARLFKKLSFIGRYFLFTLLEFVLFSVLTLLGTLHGVPLLSVPTSIAAYISPLTLIFFSDDGSWTTNMGISLAMFFVICSVLARFVWRDARAVGRMCRGERSDLLG